MSADTQRRSDGRSTSITDPLSDLENASDLGTRAMSGISTVVIASEWHFKPAGVMEVEKRFAEKRDRMRAEGYIQWNDQDHHFQLSSERHLIPLLDELNLITRAVIVEEGGDIEPDSEDDDDDDDEDTYSDASIEFQSKLIAKVADYEPLQHIRPPNPNTDDVFYPDVIKNCDYRDIWIYSADIQMDAILKLAIVLKLEAMTDSKIVKSPSQSKVYIGSDKSGSVDLVIAKLNNIAKYSLTSTSFHHIFYTEETEGCKFILKLFPEIKKRFLETTLLEQIPFPEYLPRRLTVRACPWNDVKVTHIPVKIAKYTPAVSSLGAQVSATKLWAGFTWTARGDATDDPVKYFPNGYAKEIERQEDGEETSKDENDSSAHVDIEGWVANASTTADPSQKLSGEDWGDTVGIPPNPLARLAMASEPTTNMPNGKANSAVGKDAIDQEATKDLDMILTPVKSSDICLETEMHFLDGSLSPHEDIPEQSIVQPSLLDSELDAELTNSDWNALRNNASDNALVDVSSSPTRSPNLRIFDSSDSPNTWAAHQFTALEPPELPSSFRFSEDLESLMTITPDSIAELQCSTLYPEDGSLDLLTFPDLPETSGSSNMSVMPANQWPRLRPQPNNGGSGPESINENIFPQPRRQLADEMSTRVYHKTMGQKASSKKKEVQNSPNVPEPQESFLRDTAGMFSALMAPVRGFHGQVKVNLYFGRILLGNLPVKIVSKDEQIKTFTEKSITDRLHPPPNVRPGDGPELFFTDIVSTLEADAIFLANLKDKKGARLWSETSTEWKVTYEFMCEEIRTGKYFNIEIDSETFETRIVVPKKYGEIYVHGTMRHWDLKLAVEGIEDENEIRHHWPGFDDLASEIRRTLYIPPGNRKPNHAFKVPKQIMDRFVIFHLKIRKTNTYNSLDGKSKLHITEVDKTCGHELLVKDKAFLVYIFSEEKEDYKMENNWQLNDQGNLMFILPKEKTDDTMKKNWQEVSITSVAMNNLLEQNTNLELGEEVSWTVQDLEARKISNTFIKPACIMLAQMDGVGFYNNGQDPKA